MTTVAEAPPSALWYTKETKMSSAQTPNDVVIALADLKRMLAWLTSAIVAAFVAVLISYNVRITQVEAKTSSLYQVAEYAS